MSNRLLLSPLYQVPQGAEKIERFGRSFYREDLGYGKLETSAGDLRNVFGQVHLFDLQTTRTVYLETTFFNDAVGLVDDEYAQKITEESLEYALRALPGVPPSIYQR